MSRYVWSCNTTVLVQRFPTPEEIAFELWKENLRREGHTHYIRVEAGKATAEPSNEL